jgi:ATP-dependent helicase/DNAse subunit B
LQEGGTKLFEFQSTCPFRAFAEKRLFARELDDVFVGPSYIERGKIVEKVLQRAWEQVCDWQRLNQIYDTFEFRAIVDQAVEAAVRECVPQPGRWFDNYRVVERSRLQQLALKWFDMERKRSRFDRVMHQQDVQISVGEVTVKATIDRIDELPSGDVVVIDYKSSDKYSTRLWETPRMEAPQLPLYAIAQTPGRVSGVAFGIACTHTCELSGFARNREIIARTGGTCERDMTKQIDDWRGELEALAASYLAGDAAVDPKSSHKTCKWCHLGPLCRVKEQSAMEAGDDA